MMRLAQNLFASRLIPCAASISFMVGHALLSAPCPSPTFAPQNTFAVGTGPEGIAVGYFDGNSTLDLAVVNFATDDLRVLLGYGDGTFYPRPSLALRRGPVAIATGDLDQDGRPDLAVANQGDNSVSILLGISNGDFRRHTTLPVGSQPVSVVMGDFNGDGNLDIAAANLFSSSVSVLTGDGLGGVASTVTLSVGQNPSSVAAGDLNGDGHLDLITANIGSGNLSVILANGVGGFFSAKTIAGNAGLDLALADLNRDGNLDIAGADSVTGAAAVLLGKGDGTFGALTSFPAGQSPSALAAGDINGDGKPDLVVSDDGSTNVSILLGNGEGSFAAPVNFRAGDLPGAIAVADLTGDGGPDIATANYADNNVSVLVNTCAIGPIDLRPTAMEVTQAIQDLANSVLLVAGKRTFARVHVTANGFVDGRVTARLYGYDGGGVELGSPLRPNNADGFINISASPDRARLNDSFYFELPNSWIQAGVITLKVEINTHGTVTESDYTNNSITAGPLTFLDTNPLKVRLVDYSFKDGTGRTWENIESDFRLVESETRRKFPVGNLEVTRRSFFDETPPKDLFDGLCDIYNNQSIARLRELRETWEPNSPNVFYYLLYRRCGGGAAVIGGRNGAGAADAFTHELGHMLNRRHVACSGGEAGVNASYPYPGGIIGGPAANPARFYGFDPGDFSLSVPQLRRVVTNTTGDEMGYCTPRWLSDYNYSAVRNYMQANLGAAPMMASASLSGGSYSMGDFLTCYGTIDVSAQSVSEIRLARLTQVGEVPPLVRGPYRLRLWDNNNVLLAEHAFTPEIPSEGGQGAIMGQIVRFAAGTRRIEIYSDIAERAIGSWPVSARAPTVTINSVSGLPSLPPSAPVTVDWTGSDADRDPLSYTLLYSYDNRATWSVVATGLRGNSHTINSAQLPGTKGAANGCFRVVANDGVLTGLADSLMFTLGGKPPKVHMASPGPLDVYAYGQTVTLEGLAEDLEDGQLTGAQLSWRSDREGLLGTGGLVHLSRLSAGIHQITLTATDRDMQSATRTTTIVIGYRQDAPVVFVQPIGQTVFGGASVTFSVVAAAVSPLSYQWYFNSVPMLGANASSLAINNVGAPDHGDYSVVISSAGGSVTTASARLTVLVPPVLTCPANIRVAAPQGNTWSIVDYVVTATDTQPGVLVECWPRSGDPFPFGVTVVYCVATGVAGLQSGCSFPVEVVPTPVQGNGTGLLAVYFDNQNFTGPRLARIDPTVHFNWGTKAPDYIIIDQPVRMGPDTFSARWTGQVMAPYSGVYGFGAETEDAVRLWVNGQLVIGKHNTFALQATSWVEMTAGQVYDIRIEYEEAFETAGVKLMWSVDGQPFEVIPRRQLYPSRRTSIPGLFSTGVDDDGKPLPDNAVDPHYSFGPVDIPCIGCPWPAIVATASGGFPIPPWLGDSPSSAWISVSDDTIGSGNWDGSPNYLYQVQFDLTGLDPESAAITGRWATDNRGTDILINGNSTGIQNFAQFETWSGFEITSGFVPGINTLSFLVNNEGVLAFPPDNPTGLRVELQGAADPAAIPPWVAIFAPVTVAAGADFEVSAKAARSEGRVHAINLFLDGQSLGSRPGDSGSWSFPRLPVGVYSFEAAAWDEQGNYGSSGLATVAVVHQPHLSLEVIPGGALLSWLTDEGHSYEVQYKNDLTWSSWATLQTVSGTGGAVTIGDPLPNFLHQRFYRLRVVR